MQSYEIVHLYLDNDGAGDKFTTTARTSNSLQFFDERSLYSGYKDLNDWHRHIGLRMPQDK
ncbi:toprim domain-containing protein [Niabella ginsengisoli]|uniref:Toprim domain-containing protein n=1 Tax=Niabella ginsengisoli TaxID=522298 RepID=A0ABS9SI27_9BACT|nr:toprim domain-containing protein [Niabella ginsengisoli]MCH5598017.1 toprim domain-containing protein [Niabella ginsengisoli]